MLRGVALLFCALAGCGGRSDLLLSGAGTDAAGRPDSGDASPASEAAAPPPTLEGVVYTDCGPSDGPAFGLVITTRTLDGCNGISAPPAPFDRIEVYQALPTAPVTLVVTGANGLASVCATDPPSQAPLCTTATSTALRLEVVTATSMSGQYTMTLPDGTSRARSFTVSVCATMPLCG